VTLCSDVVGYQCSKDHVAHIFRVKWRTMLPPSSLWRWRQHGPLKRWYTTTSLNGVITQKTTTLILSPFLPFSVI